MSNFQAEKKLVLDFYDALYGATADSVADDCAKFFTDDYLWRGYHPFNTQNGWHNVAEKFYKPLKHAAAEQRWTRRPDMFFAGKNFIDDYQSTWVVEMGHMVFFFEKPWLNIPANNKITFFRYVEFHRVENGKIAESASYNDILYVMEQAGVNPLKSQTGAMIVSPGPMTHDGLLHHATDPKEGEKTLDLIHGMILELIALGNDSTNGTMPSPIDHLADWWSPNMFWWGPCGIGASGGTLKGYIHGHAGPFEKQLEFISHNGHICRTAEGNFGGFFGYPSMTMRNTGNYMGVPSNDIAADMRIVDLYRRDGDKLAENWIFIDMLNFLYMQGHDVLGDLPPIE